MVNALLIGWGIAAGVMIMLLLDWLGRRKERQSKHRPGA